jgi:23S rRNA pseudouridine2605 synthase
VLQLGEGRPHLVKRLCAAVGHPVLRLFRPAQASVSVAGLAPGQVRPLTPEEVRRVEGIAAGEPLPPVELFLPPRRHGRSGADGAELDGAEEVEAERPAKRGGTQAPPAAPPGERGARRGPGRAGTRSPHPRGARPGPERAGAGFPRQAGAGQGHGGGRAEGSEHRRTDRRWGAPDAERAPRDDRPARRPGSEGPRFGRGGGGGSRPPERRPFSGGPDADDVHRDSSEGRPGRTGRGPSFGRGAGRGSRPPKPRSFSSDRSGTRDDLRPRRSEPGNARRNADPNAGARWKRAERGAGPPWKGRERDGRGDGERGPRRGGEFRDRRGQDEARGRSPRPAPTGGRPGATGSGGRPARGRFGIARSGPPRSFSQARDTGPRTAGGRPGGGPRRPPRGSSAPRTRGNWPGPRGGGAGGRGRGGGPRRH